METWKDIIGSEGIYRISTLGNVFSILSNCPVKSHLCCGYLIVPLKRGNRTNKSPKVHRLVAESFIPNLLNLPQVNHINGIKTDNRVENLEWCTAKRNTNHSIEIGLRNDIGVNNKNVNYNEIQIKEIIIKYNSGNYTQKQLADEYLTSQGHISRIVLKKLWKHI